MGALGAFQGYCGWRPLGAGSIASGGGSRKPSIAFGVLIAFEASSERLPLEAAALRLRFLPLGLSCAIVE